MCDDHEGVQKEYGEHGIRVPRTAAGYILRIRRAPSEHPLAQTQPQEPTLGRSLAKSGTLGTVLHGSMCPAHGLPMLLAKVGMLPTAAYGTINSLHERIVDYVAHATQLFYEHEQAHDAAHTLVEMGGLSLALGLPAIAVANHVRRRAR